MNLFSQGAPVIVSPGCPRFSPRIWPWSAVFEYEPQTCYILLVTFFLLPLCSSFPSNALEDICYNLNITTNMAMKLQRPIIKNDSS